MRSLFAQSGVLRDVIIIVLCLVAVWVGLQAYFGTQNPFYVVSSGSMVPDLEMYDILVVSGNSPFGEVGIGDIIVFNRPSGHDRVIVHRVVAIADEDPRTLRTKGDANPSSIPGTDFPITDEEYIGSVVYVIPQAGYITRVLSPPVNYIIIAVIVGIMIAKHLYGRKGGEDEGAEQGVEGDPEQASRVVGLADTPPGADAGGGTEQGTGGGTEQGTGGRSGPPGEPEGPGGGDADQGGGHGPRSSRERQKADKQAARADQGGGHGPRSFKAGDTPATSQA